MIKLSHYIKMSLKRAFKLLPVIAVTSAIFITALGAALMVMVKGNDELKLRVRVGLVGDTEGEHLGIGIGALEQLDSSSVAIEFIEYDGEEKAREDLKDGYLSAYVFVPDGFIDDVLVGDNNPMTLITADRADDLVPSMIREVADGVSIYVVDSQRSIYGMRRCVREYDLEEVELSEATDDLNIRYISLVTERGSWAEVVETGEMGTSSYGGYYLCSFLFLLLMLFSVMATPLFSGGGKNCAYYKSYGVGSVKQVGAETVSYGSLVLVIILALCIVLSVLLPGGIVSELSGYSVISMLGFFLRALPFMLLIIMLSVFLWELVPGTVNGILVQFIASIGIGYVSGCFYPSNMFPEAVQSFASVLPTGVALAGLRDALSGGWNILRLITCVIMCAGLFAATCALRSYRLKKGGKE